MRGAALTRMVMVAVCALCAACTPSAAGTARTPAASSTSPTTSAVEAAAAAPTLKPMRVVQTVPLDRDTTDVDIAVDGDELWVASGPTGSVNVIALADMTVARTMRSPGFEAGNYLALTPTRVWMSLNGSHDLVSFDRVTGKAHGVAMGRVRSMFVATEGERVVTAYSDIDDRVARVSALDGTEAVAAQAEVADLYLADVERCGGRTWLAGVDGRGSGRLVRLDDPTIDHQRAIDLAFAPVGLAGATAMACADARLWVIGITGGDAPTAHVAVVDAGRAEVVETGELGAGAPTSVVPHGTGAFVTLNHDGAHVVLVDAAAREVHRLRVGEGRAWEAVLHGGRLLVERTPPDKPSVIDVVELAGDSDGVPRTQPPGRAPVTELRRT